MNHMVGRMGYGGTWAYLAFSTSMYEPYAWGGPAAGLQVQQL